MSIKCPNCGCEFYFCELDAHGFILYRYKSGKCIEIDTSCVDTDVNQEVTYHCEECGKTFKDEVQE